MSVNEDCLKTTADTGELRLRVLTAVRGVVHARKEGNEGSIVGLKERVYDVGKPLAKLVLCTKEEGMTMNGYDVTTRQGLVIQGIKRG
jgi:hypothetical protein